MREEIPGLDDVIAPAWPESLTFDAPGEGYEGRLVTASKIQSSSFETREPETWSDGRPKMIPVLVLDVDGAERTWFVRGKAQNDALRLGLREAHVSGLAVGDFVSVVHTHTEPVESRQAGGRGKSLNERKMFVVTVKPATD